MKKNRHLETEGQISISSRGGVGECVTGSAHLLKLPGFGKLLVDCGLHQGRDGRYTFSGQDRNFLNMRDWLYGVRDVVLTHSHIDHSGNLPKLIKSGIEPRIWLTRVAAVFTEILLRNSAEIQDGLHASERLYDEGHVDQTVDRFVPVDYDKDFDLGSKGIPVVGRIIPNGHVPGSGAAMLRYKGEVFLFSGDIGRPYQQLGGGYEESTIKYPDRPINTLIVDSTNVEASPVTFEEKKEGLLDLLNQTWKDGGNPLLPVLSFDRAQAVLEMLKHFQSTGQIPKDVKIYLDAPLAVEILDKYVDLYDVILTTRFGADLNYYQSNTSSRSRFWLDNMTVVDSHKDSLAFDKELAKTKEKVIIVAGGGMGVGRSMNYLWGDFGANPKNMVGLTCYQVRGTPGERLMDRGIVGNERDAGAKVVKLEGWTSHAMGFEEWFGFLEKFNLSELDTVLVGHGSDSAKKFAADRLKEKGIGARLIIPEIGQVYTL